VVCPFESLTWPVIQRVIEVRVIGVKYRYMI
jgi:hypothetical protein